jgi:hypothetical protein
MCLKVLNTQRNSLVVIDGSMQFKTDGTVIYKDFNSNSLFILENDK